MIRYYYVCFSYILLITDFVRLFLKMKNVPCSNVFENVLNKFLRIYLAFRYFSIWNFGASVFIIVNKNIFWFNFV